MSDIITRCPGCSVAFRASPAHLQAANGLVRCGACLHVFNAHEHEAPSKIDEQAVEEAEESVLLEEDNILAGDLFDATDNSPEQTITESTIEEPAQPTLINEAVPDHSEQTVEGPFDDIPESLRPPSTLARKPQWHWWLLSLLATAAIALQYAHFHADILGLQPEYRPHIEKLCALTGCQLPKQIDTRKIRSTNLIIHSHPKRANALIANVVIINQAGFDQPFPGLLLIFEDLQGQSVAQRRFEPREYLQGELTGAVIMPRNQPIKLTLELVDPGPQAVNFALYVAE